MVRNELVGSIHRVLLFVCFKFVNISKIDFFKFDHNESDLGIQVNAWKIRTKSKNVS